MLTVNAGQPNHMGEDMGLATFWEKRFLPYSAMYFEKLATELKRPFHQNNTVSGLRALPFHPRVEEGAKSHVWREVVETGGSRISESNCPSLSACRHKRANQFA
jgi:hypothetical protein